MTNTYAPHIGGVARSIDAFSNEYRLRGHNVKVIAPTFKDYNKEDKNVIRIPAIQNFNGSDFSVALPIPGIITSAVKDFMPDVIHSHHPFLIGSSALRVAHTYEIPLVFTHHTKYEEYTHYVPGDSELLKRFVINLSTNYANLCDVVFTPSESIHELIIRRGVHSKVVTLPTGVNTRKFKNANGLTFRQSLEIPKDAYVIGHLGRLAKEKNLEFLVEAITKHLISNDSSKNVYVLFIGEGPMKTTIIDYFKNKELSNRLYTAGLLSSKEIVDAYNAMDLFVFSSKSETQGMVITEAMAAGTPVIAIDAPGVREVVKNNINGKLLFNPSSDEFSMAITSFIKLSKNQKTKFSREALKTANEFSLVRSADKALSCFEALKTKLPVHRDKDYQTWTHALNLIESDWERIKEITSAAESALKGTNTIS